MVICQERGADLHTAQLTPLPLTVSCFSKIQIGFTFLVPAHRVVPQKDRVSRAQEWMEERLSWVPELHGLPGEQVYSSSQGCHTATRTHMPHGITQCYLPPGRGDIPAVTPAEAGTRLSDPGGMQG